MSTCFLEHKCLYSFFNNGCEGCDIFLCTIEFCLTFFFENLFSATGRTKVTRLPEGRHNSS